ncbi:MAG: quinolinate synthase NadA [Fimbriimonadaceae bacterium]|nr:quinolinate synthase NadA [Fimbriimonadaceae bacterium]
MYQTPLAEEYTTATQEELDERTRIAKQSLGERVVVLGHHYQRDEIVAHADYLGDSYKLAKDAASHPQAEYIVFCGVHFMAESADILTPPSQAVILPNLAAGCSMADMASQFQVRLAWKALAEVLGDIEPEGSAVPRTGQGPSIVPVTYMNSAASLKAFVGEHGGTVCTSTNAERALGWAFERGQKVLFFPDQHLGRNTGLRMGLDPETDMALWDPYKPLGGNTPSQLAQARLLLWKGHCSVHKRFTVEQIEEARREHPGARVIVHPECPMEVFLAADESGSTEMILKAVRQSEPGTVWAVGTEINLVKRLAAECADKTVFCLDPEICPCSTMYRIHPGFLCWAMESLARGEVMNRITVPEGVARWARLALQRMLEIGPAAASIAG